ncbi:MULTISPECIES: helix-turn-helix domain-containing protein [Nocardiopsis]|jgi:nitroimidazol reductase NimA-like FMN-containing flavoprotein (pyridoxamine 5'-phosphate oxidase superfamily)|uniref:Helix-turn-helix domain-containing protein n=1 Tax=Nocardiopsis alba TaxID=53437 RepID=A0A7K2IYI6_9ACTN|nr:MULTISPECIES: pyridoxamine 5'-phosphate oxidase family protein [Nocardiopsis]MEC3891760.1 pyridoxamine 5'-phosphate oxidase family protein [Nocardiopsis sp. LDBS1602]MYR34906.1 helix-turn-helix domain-containing protein [Nocardiopsis alba]
MGHQGAAIPDGGDLGHRAAARRRELGLTREQVAERADMDPGYVAYLEEHTPRMTRPALYRLAEALNTTQDHLLGTDTDLPPGAMATEVPLPRTTVLSSRRCLELIEPGGVGRVGLVTGESAPVILPVNYLFHEGAIVFRTKDDGVIGERLPQDIAFEVDRVDDAMSQGWSVLVRGRAEAVTDRALEEELRAHAPVRPWAGGERDLFVRVVPEEIGGREVSGRVPHAREVGPPER